MARAELRGVPARTVGLEALQRLHVRNGKIAENPRVTRQLHDVIDGTCILADLYRETA